LPYLKIKQSESNITIKLFIEQVNKGQSSSNRTLERAHQEREKGPRGYIICHLGLICRAMHCSTIPTPLGIESDPQDVRLRHTAGFDLLEMI